MESGNLGADYLEAFEAEARGSGTSPSCQYDSSTGRLWCQYRFVFEA